VWAYFSPDAVSSSVPTALDSYWKFTMVGFSCFHSPDIHTQKIAATASRKNEVAEGICFSGSSREVVDCMRIAKQNGTSTVYLLVLLRHSRVGPLHARDPALSDRLWVRPFIQSQCKSKEGRIGHAGGPSEARAGFGEKIHADSARALSEIIEEFYNNVRTWLRIAGPGPRSSRPSRRLGGTSS
jgi:hypothetical protein